MVAIRHLDEDQDRCPHDPRAREARAPGALRLVAEPPVWPPGPVGDRVAGREATTTYVRRRIAVGLVGALALVGVLALGAAGAVSDAEAAIGAAEAGQAPQPGEERAGGEGSVHVVLPGESYWSIAGAMDHGGDHRLVVDALVDANGGRSLQVGDRIVLPW